MEQEERSKKRSAEAIRDEMDECESTIALQKQKLAALRAEPDLHPSDIVKRLGEWGVPALYWSRLAGLARAGTLVCAWF